MTVNTGGTLVYDANRTIDLNGGTMNVAGGTTLSRTSETGVLFINAGTINGPTAGLLSRPMKFVRQRTSLAWWKNEARSIGSLLRIWSDSKTFSSRCSTLIEQSGEAAEIVKTPEGFKAKEW